MEVDFDKLFKVMILAMRANKSHPYIVRDKRWIFQFLCMHGSFSLIFCGLVYCIIFKDLKGGDFVQACSNGILCVVFIVVTFNYSIMLWYQSSLRDMINIMKQDYESLSELPLNERRIIVKYALMGKGVMTLWLRISICTAGLFPIKAVVYMIYYKIIGEFKFVHLYDLTYPPAIEDIKNEPGPYTALYVIFLYYDIYAMFMYIGFAPLGPIFMLHACGQLEIIRSRILNLFDDKNIPSGTTMRNLTEIVVHLQTTYSFIDNIKQSHKVLYELTLKATTLILPITFYLVIQSFHNSEISLEFVTIIVGAMTLSSIPCYYSDLLMETGESLRFAIYSCGWEKHWDPRTRSVLLLILTRSARPVGVRTMFRTVCLDALTDIYHQSYAIFNVLNAIWN